MHIFIIFIVQNLFIVVYVQTFKARHFHLSVISDICQLVLMKDHRLANSSKASHREQILNGKLFPRTGLHKC